MWFITVHGRQERDKALAFVAAALSLCECFGALEEYSYELDTEALATLFERGDVTCPHINTESRVNYVLLLYLFAILGWEDFVFFLADKVSAVHSPQVYSPYEDAAALRLILEEVDKNGWAAYDDQVMAHTEYPTDTKFIACALKEVYNEGHIHSPQENEQETAP